MAGGNSQRVSFLSRSRHFLLTQSKHARELPSCLDILLTHGLSSAQDFVNPRLSKP